MLSVTLVDPVTTAKNKPGDTFRARLQDGVWLQGRVAVPPGATIRGRVMEAVPSGRVRGQAKLVVTLSSLELEGKSYELATDTLTYVGEGHQAKHFGSGLMGALQGAVYGVLFGGKAGAILGAGAGAAANSIGSIWSGKEDVSFAQGAQLMFELQRPVAVPEPPPAAAAAKSDDKAAPAEKPAAKDDKDAKPST